VHAHIEEKGRRMRTHACMPMPGGGKRRQGGGGGERRKERKKEKEGKKERKKERKMFISGGYKDVACSSKHIIII
jgi:hypothetical protein